MDIDKYTADLERRKSERPICLDCGGNIQEESAFQYKYPKLNIDYWLCEECEKEHRKYF